MVRVFKFTALLLLAVWLPATLHCALVETGLLAQTCLDNCSTGQSGGKDACGTIEDGAYKPTTDVLRAPAPDVLACACFLCLNLVPAEPVCEWSILPSETFQRSESRVATWHFARRAAPLPGAPSLVLA